MNVEPPIVSDNTVAGIHLKIISRHFYKVNLPFLLYKKKKKLLFILTLYSKYETSMYFIMLSANPIQSAIQSYTNKITKHKEKK